MAQRTYMPDLDAQRAAMRKLRFLAGSMLRPSGEASETLQSEEVLFHGILPGTPNPAQPPRQNLATWGKRRCPQIVIRAEALQRDPFVRRAVPGCSMPAFP